MKKNGMVVAAGESRRDYFARRLGLAMVMVLALLVLFVNIPLAQTENYVQTWQGADGDIWDNTSNLWSGRDDSGPFLENDAASFGDTGGSSITVNIIGSGITTSGMRITAGSYVFDGGSIIANASYVGDAPDFLGSLQISTTGRVDLNVATSLVYGITLSSGSLYIGNENALGTFNAASAKSSSSIAGQLVMSDQNAHVYFKSNYNLSNRFLMRNGVLTIADGQTITVSGVHNTTADSYGGAFRIDNSASVVGSGNLVIQNNSAASFGGAVYGTNINLSSLSSLVISNNASTGQSGGGIYSLGGTGLVLGSNVVFSGNTATLGSGGAIYGATSVGIAGNTLFENNTAGGASNSIYLDQNTAVTVSGTGNYNVYFDDPLSSGANGGNSFTKSGTGFVQFQGDNVLNANGGTGGAVAVNAGTFRVVEGASFADNGMGGTFTLAQAATLAGGGSITSGQIIIEGILSPDKQIFAAPSGIGTSAGLVAGDSVIGSGNEIATLTINGNTQFNSAQLDISLGSGNTSDLIQVNGQIAFGALSTVNINSGIVTGSYQIMVVNVASNYEIALTDFNALVLHNGQALSPRYGTAVLEIKSSGGALSNNELWLNVTQTVGKLRLEWAGDYAGYTGVWSDSNTANNNWVNTQYRLDFQSADYAYFASTYTENNQSHNAVLTVTVEQDGVSTSGMHVNSGSYTFTGGSISGAIDGAAGTWNTGDLLVDGTANVTFENEIAFTEGMKVEGSSASVTLAGGGSFDDDMAIAVNNGAELTFNTGRDYVQTGVITTDAASTVYKEGQYALTLNADNSNALGAFMHNAGTVNLNYAWGGNYIQDTAAGALNVKNGTGATIGGEATFGGVVDMQNSATNTVLNVGSTVHLNGATLKIDIDADGSSSDRILATGALGSSRTIAGVDISSWQIGTYTILTTTNMSGWSLQLSDYTITLNGGERSKRQYAVLEVSGNNLNLITQLANIQLTWTGGASGVWNTTESNVIWNDAGMVSPETTYFRDLDYVTFKHTDAVNHTVAIQSALTVSGMDIESGIYTFTGSALSGTGQGVVNPDGSWTATGAINVNGGTATFQNSLSFEAGMNIAGGAVVNLYSGSNVNNTDITSAGTINIANGSTVVNTITNTGTINFNTGDGSTTYTHSGAITGAGTVNKTNAGTLNLSGTYNNSGTFNQSNGTTNLNSDWGGKYNLTGGTLNATGSKTITGAASFGKATVSLRDVSGYSTLTVDSLQLAGATININIGATNQSDLISVTNAVTYTAGTQTIFDIQDWVAGTYTLVSSGSTLSLDAFGNVTKNGQTLSVRGGGAVLSLANNDQDLILTITGNGMEGNLRVVWGGQNAAGNQGGLNDTDVWNTAKSNWIDENSQTSLAFMTNDYAVFIAQYAKGVQVDINGVTVSGMEIQGGEYVFTGGAINGGGNFNDDAQDANSTHKLDVQTGAIATFANELIFSGGMGIASGAIVNLADGSNVDATAVTVDTGGELNFTNDSLYTHAGILTGSGTVNKSGDGVLNLSGTYSSNGSFNQTGGTVNLNSDWGGNYSQDADTYLNTSGIRAISGDAVLAGELTVNGVSGNYGQLNVGGLLTLDGSTLNLALGSTANTAGFITAGSIDVVNPNNIYIGSGWTTGNTYNLIIVNTGSGLTSTSGFTLADAPAGNRTTPTLSIASNVGGKDILQVTFSSQNLYLTWQGGSGSWNAAGVWNDGSVSETFVAGDHINISAGSGTLSLTGNAAVAGMTITGGNYTISGGTISSTTTIAGDLITTADRTQRLDITGNGTAINFTNTTLNFVNGMTVGSNASAVLGSGANVSATNIANAGQLNIGAGSVLGSNTITNTGEVYFTSADAYTHSGTITGASGNIYKDTAGRLTLDGIYANAGTFNQGGGEVVLNYEWGGNYLQSSGLLTGNANISGDYSQTGGTLTSVDGMVISGQANFSGTVNIAGTGIGSLNVGELTLNGATLVIDSNNGANDYISSSGAINFGGINSNITLSLENWTGSDIIFLIGSISDADADAINNGAYFNTVTIAGGGLRQSAVVRANDSEAWLEVTSSALNLTWNGGLNGYGNEWNSGVVANKNWKNDANGDEYFINGDSVAFANVAGVNKNVVVNNSGVTADVVTITGTDFIFSGGNIEAHGASTVTAGASATFRNNAYFGWGLENMGTVTVAGSGFVDIIHNQNILNLTEAGSVDFVTNEGVLNINTNDGYIHNGAIMSLGNVTSVNKSNAGVLTLAGDYSYYLGVFNQSAGTVNLNSNWGGSYNQTTGVFNSAAGVAIAGNASFSGTVSVAGDSAIGTLNVGSLHLNGATLNINASGTDNDLIISGDAVTLAGLSSVNLYLDNWTGGTTITIISGVAVDDYAGMFGPVNIVGGSLRQSATIGGNGTSIYISLAGNGALDLIWNGGNGNTINWNSNVVANTNWLNNNNDADYFINNDSVSFNNNGSAKTVVVDGAGVTAGTVTINGTDFVFSNGNITAASGRVNIGGSATFTNNATFTSLGGLNNAGIVTVAGAGSVNSITNSGTVNINDGTVDTVTNSGTLNFVADTAYTHSGTISGTGDINKTGAGALTLAGTYAGVSGTFTQQTGNVTLNYNWGGVYVQDATAGSFTSGANSSINSSATFNGTVNVAGTGTTGTLSVGNLTLNGASITMTIASGANDLIASRGVVTASGVTINLDTAGWTWTAGQYTLMTAVNGGISLSDFVLGVQPTMTGRQGLALSVNGDTSLVLNAYLANAAQRWKGNVDTAWNQTTANWTGVDNLFQTNDYAIFGTDATRFDVNIEGAVVTVSGMEIEGGVYTFTGGAINGGGSFTYDSASIYNTHALAVKNDAVANFANTLVFSGGMSIDQNATVNLKDGSNVDATAITNLGELNFDAANAYTHSGTISGNGTF